MEEANEILENEVMMLLPDLEPDALEQMCELIPVPIPEASKGKKNSLLKLLFKHLMGLATEEDGGFATYKILHERLVKKEVKVETTSDLPAGEVDRDLEVKVEKVDAAMKPSHKSASALDIYSLKDLKISGTIGGVSEKDKLSWLSLSYQIENAKKLGYSEEKICGAIIKAIAPTNHLRTYIESRPDLHLSSVQDILSSHFKEKDSAATFTELSSTKQLDTETCLDFVLRILCLRHKVLQLSIEEGCPYEKKVLTKRFHQTLFSGLRNINI